MTKTKIKLKHIFLCIGLIAIIISLMAAPMMQSFAEEFSVLSGFDAGERIILAFEDKNPVYSINAYKDTEFEKLYLPNTLRAVFSITKEEAESFLQEEPKPDPQGDFDYYRYGYVAPADEAELRARGERVIYTINYANGETAYRVYGSVGGGVPGYYACSKEGNLTGRIEDVEITWDKSQYIQGEIGKEQRLIPRWDEAIAYKGEEIYASVTVTDMTEEEARSIEEKENTEEVSNTEEVPSDAMMMSGAAAVKVAPIRYAQARKEIQTYTATKNNKDGTGGYSKGIKGSWKDYVNTIWLNKAFNQFSFAKNSVPTGWKWNGQPASDSNHNDPSKDPNAVPRNVNSTFDVYSVQQLDWVLRHLPSTATINIQRDLDFNGENCNWDGWNRKLYFSSLTINGNGHTFYNLFSYANTFAIVKSETLGTFLNYRKRGSNFSVSDLTFSHAFCAVFTHGGGGLFGYGDYNDKYNPHHLTEVAVEDSLFYNGGQCLAAYQGLADADDYAQHIAPFGTLATASGKNATISRCRVEGCSVYGADHVCGLVARTNFGLKADHTCVTDTLIAGTGGHSAGFISCQSEGSPSDIRDCFVNVHMYGSKDVAGFSLLTWGKFDNCFSTGKIEGYDGLYGFQGDLTGSGTTVTNCYSTALVGMRSEAKNIAGFTHGAPPGRCSITDCYAAGEVGDHTTDMEKNGIAGGFALNNPKNMTYKNCFYDKQTTAMREWVNAYRNTQKTAGIDGIAGVLTTTTEKGGTGLTAKPVPGKKGFTGFSSDHWYYENGLYPQLTSMQAAKAADWGSQKQADLAKANSLASVSTVFLDTWDKGFDWNSFGVRSKDEVSYARTPQDAYKAAQKSGSAPPQPTHLGSEYTYDTVREIISDFSSSPGAKFTYAIPGGALTTIDNWKTKQETEHTRAAFTVGETLTQKITPWKVAKPGMEWFNISRGANKEAAERPIRLIAFMNVEAGEDKSLPVNQTYDHRQDVSLSMMETLTPNLVVGFDNAKIWSTSAIQGYPGYQFGPEDKNFGQLLDKGGTPIKQLDKHYYEVSTAPTAFSASKDAWLYTEIWNIAKDGKPLTQPKSVKVTGEGTNGKTLTATEQQWMGELPLGAGEHAGMKFEISYYWMLKDGRYRTDSKTITLTPGQYRLTEKVYNEDKSPNSTALKLAARKDNKIEVGANTMQSAELAPQNWGTDVLAAWKAASPQDTAVISLGLQYSAAGKPVSWDPQNKAKQPILYNPKPGDKLSIEAPYYGYREETEQPPGGDKYRRLVSSFTPINVKLVYEVKEKQGVQYLQFDKQATYSESGWDKKLAGEGIEIKEDPFSGMKINDIAFDIDVVLVVSEDYSLQLNKIDGADKTPLSGVSFSLYEMMDDRKVTPKELKATTPAEQILVNGVKQSQAGTKTGGDGKLYFQKLKNNRRYYLVETTPLDGYAEYKGMLKIYRDLSGRITMQRIDENGEIKGPPAIYRPEPQTLQENVKPLELNKNPRGGMYVSATMENYQDIHMPESGGERKWFILVGSSLLLLGTAALWILRREKRKDIHR